MGETNLPILIKNMHPILREGEYVFCTVSRVSVDNENIIFYFKEEEGITIVCSKEYATQNNYSFLCTFSWITLKVNSSLAAVGLTAAFSQALTQNHISCNVVAGFYHDHIFVPSEKAHLAIHALQELSKSV